MNLDLRPLLARGIRSRSLPLRNTGLASLRLAHAAQALNHGQNHDAEPDAEPSTEQDA